MRITEATRFPHPVLSEDTGDFLEGAFELTFIAEETPATGALSLEYEIKLTEPAIRDLLVAGDAVSGCFIRCIDTYYSELKKLSWPKGRIDFPPGSLLNRVTLRPLIWLRTPLNAWDPGTLHAEFDPPVELGAADIIAVAPEHVLSVGQAKFARLESIFELVSEADLPEGRIKVNPDADKISIRVAAQTFETIALLLGQAKGLPVVMNAIYMPAVMEVLDLLRSERDHYSGRRWYQPFVARLDAAAIELNAGTSLLEVSQILLEMPARLLATLVGEGDE